jgi:bromodomain-containing protein 3
MGSIKDQNHDNNNGNFSNSNEIGHDNMKMCRQILTKLMKHKQSWIYNSPVDAAALGLHDYHQIIKRPMDLGTIKSNMAKNLYSSPAGYASDIRLVFNNAMLYNPKTDAVHIMAKELLDWFEDMFRPISQKIQNITSNRRDNRHNFSVDDDELQGSSCNDIRQKEPKIKKSKPSPIIAPVSRQSNKLQVPPQQPKVISSVRTPSPVPAPQPIVMSPVRTPSPVPVQQPIVMSPVRTPSPVPAQQPDVLSPVKTPSPVPAQQQQQQQQQQEQVKSIGKLPKPKAKDPNKRGMTEEEKHKLGFGLQNLPQEKMPQLVQIIKKKNDHLDQDGDEIELDIEALDTETLWELDRFVTNWKKFASKTKREALMGNYPPAPTPAPDQIPLSDTMDDITKVPEKGFKEEDEVDIGDEIEIPENNFQPLEMDEDANDVQLPEPTQGQNRNNPSISSGSSSSSGSDSSSSDSGSSSGSDSVANEAQS